MKVLVGLFLIILLTNCARVTVNTEDDNGRDWTITSTTFGKKLEGVTATVGEIEFSLGSSTTDVPFSNEVVACLIAPGLCK